jgi:NADPH-dependent glutamate synthase beta subunit-like oxidoreductase
VQKGQGEKAIEKIQLTIDGHRVEVPCGTTILEAARGVGIYIPTLCSHPDLPPATEGSAAPAIFQGGLKIENAQPEARAKGCGVCVVMVEGQAEPVAACITEVRPHMIVATDNDQIKAKRQASLVPILKRHRHACLTCDQQEGCSRSQCSSHVPENERCCTRFGNCELQHVVNFIGIPDETPRWIPTDLPLPADSPLFTRDYNLCIGCTRCVRACRDLRGVEALGFVYDKNGQIQVGSLQPELEASGCRFCTACVAVCPTGALMDKSRRFGEKKEDLVPCRAACPAHIDIPEYVRLIGQGKSDEAHAVIREKVPFAGVLGRVCFHPCEDACRRGDVNEPIAICALKRYAADNQKGYWKKASLTQADTGKRVAVAGAGPAGLTAAFYLRKQGHGVSIIEAEEKAGGMMRHGIPSYRLPADVVDKEIQEILDLGVVFQPGKTLGKDVRLEELKHNGFDAVFLALGARQSRRTVVDGCDNRNVLWGLEFLRNVAKGMDTDLKGRVLVIGGGKVAVDAALTAKRVGAERVMLACLESEEAMPAGDRETASAREEGIEILPCLGLRKIHSRGDTLTGVDLVECTCVFDEQGKFCPQFKENHKECIPVDQVIMAVGQFPDLSFRDEDSAVRVQNGLIVVDQEDMQTHMPGVYAGGDAVDMAGTVINAIAAGRKAAVSIDRALGGRGEIEEVLFERGTPDPYIGCEASFAAKPRGILRKRDVAARRGFEEVVLGFDEADAVREAGRCLQCDLRLFLGCNPSPPARVIQMTRENIEQVPVKEGVYQLYDQDRNILAIKGTADLRKSLLLDLAQNDKTTWFAFEADPMYSRRESELIQQYVQAHGEMPGDGNDDLF